MILSGLFKFKNVDISQSLSSLILSFTNLVFNVIAAIIVPKMNKKIAFFVGYILTNLCVLVIGLFFKIIENK